MQREEVEQQDWIGDGLGRAIELGVSSVAICL